ncbi:acyl-CoA/acyl-ACP dehydrogenase [Nonomuraea sp. NN258]|uniref:acyl-CoA dehydrogenase family protein n=1 Tax=Nonomuraea antri TaxID=2730852 RepID=UPI00156805FB|nr:acyl-CoA dehydrogenase family protein [Nonomuraea antri]NRQ39127.1 acyl-CoA/acyl-ACP dehydrogenase [Nonomuraea antri]
MNFIWTDEQLALGATVRDVLRAHCPPAALRTERRPAWEQLAELGFFGLLAPQECDGLGLALTDVLPALEETGRACLPGPVVDTAIAAPYLVDEVPKLVSGAVTVAVIPPGQEYAADADLADLLIVAGPDGLRQVDRASARLTPVPGADPCRRLFEVAFDPGESVRLAAAPEPALHRATVATAAQLIGVARELLDASVTYARARRQFGTAIGTFQAVKHRLADVAIDVEFAAPLVCRAALSVDRGTSTGERDVSAAKAAAGEAACAAARAALQVHGAIGYTEELDLRFWLARAWSLSAAYGTSAEHRRGVRDHLTRDLRRYP